MTSYIFRGVLFGLVAVGAMLVGIAVVSLIGGWMDLTFFGLLMVVGFLLFWGGALYDIWRRSDFSMASRLLWTAVVVFLPILGTVIYALVRPAGTEVSYGEAPP